MDGNWRAFLIVIAGLTLLCAFFGSFFKPLKPSSAQIDQVAKITGEYIEKNLDLGGGIDEKTPSLRLKNSVASIAVERTTSPYVAPGIAIERFSPAHNGSFVTKRHHLSAIEHPFLSTIELHASRQGVCCACGLMFELNLRIWT